MPVQVRPAVPEAASGDNRPFWAIFYAKKTARRKALPRLFIAFQASCFLRAFYDSPFPPLVFAFIRNMRLAKPPANAPMGAAEDMSAASRHAISIPAAAPIAAEAATTVANAIAMMKRGPIFMTLPFEKYSYTHDQGLLSPFDKSWVKA